MYLHGATFYTHLNGKRYITGINSHSVAMWISLSLSFIPSFHGISRGTLPTTAWHEHSTAGSHAGTGVCIAVTWATWCLQLSATRLLHNVFKLTARYWPTVREIWWWVCSCSLPVVSNINIFLCTGINVWRFVTRNIIKDNLFQHRKTHLGLNIKKWFQIFKAWWC